MAWVTVSTPSSSTAISVSGFGAGVAGNLGIIGGSWSTYVPVLTNITKGNGTLTGRFNQTGKTVDFAVQFTLGSTSAMGSTPTISLPATAQSTTWNVTGTAFVAAITNPYLIIADCTTTSVVTLRALPGTAGNQLLSVNSTVPNTWTTGNTFTISGRYEAA